MTTRRKSLAFRTQPSMMKPFTRAALALTTLAAPGCVATLEFGETEAGSSTGLENEPSTSTDPSAETFTEPTESGEGPEDSAETDGAGASTSGETGEPSFEKLMLQFVAARCEAVLDCCDVDPDTASTVGECIERLEPAWLEPLEEAEARGLEFDFGCYAEKFDLLTNTACPTLEPGAYGASFRIHACDLWVGDGVEGDACESTNDWSTCSSGLSCEYSVCRAPSTDGPCESGLGCAEGYTCGESACEPRGDAGDPCFSSLACKETLRCNQTEGICEAAFAVGERCVEASDCTSLNCGAGTCAPAASTVCIAPFPVVED